MENSPIFFDPSQKRARRVRFFAVTGAVVGLLLFGAFLITVFGAPIILPPQLRPPVYRPDLSRHSDPNIRKETKTAHGKPIRYAAVNESKVHGIGANIVGGFFVNWNEVSLASLRVHADQLTHLFPGWLHLTPDGGKLVFTDSDPTDIGARQVARDHHLAIVPLINNFDSTVNDFEGKRLHKMLVDVNKRHAIRDAIKKYVVNNEYAGINLDFETDDEDDRLLLAQFAREVADVLHPIGKTVSADVSSDEDAIHAAALIAQSCDFIVPMIYDQHWSGSKPGAIAPLDWSLQQLDALRKVVPNDKIVVAVGNYAYDWEDDTSNAKSLTFGEAMATARESDGIVHWDVATQNPYFTYTEEDNKPHTTWFMDAVTAYNFQQGCEKRGVGGRALWYVGSEDPTLWSFFGRGRKTGNYQKLAKVRYGFEVDFEGEGEVLDVIAMPQPGSRVLRLNTSGQIVSEKFTVYPTACIVRRSGKTESKLVALTFDDGPDPAWTPQVLDILKRYKAPATFFVIGSQAEQYPDLLRRIWNEGHDIGNHSWSHPNMATISTVQTNWELAATQRVIQATVGHSTTLFRPPFGIDVEPTTSEEMRPLLTAKKHGYLTVAESVDPRDWEIGATSASIVKETLRGIRAGEGHVVLLHDAGGNRAETLAALPIIIDKLRADGYRFVPISAFITQRSRAALFPATPGKERLSLWLDRNIFSAHVWTGRLLTGLFIFSIVAGIVRLLLVALLALRKSPVVPIADRSLKASVIIAAYNEEKVIARTIAALNTSDWQNMEVIVVDDGSKDNTAVIVRERFGDDPRIRLIEKPNGGKASALNRGIEVSNGDVLIGLDADTLFAPDTITQLMRHFSDLTVGAVAGNVHVGNTDKWLARFQSIEYTTAQNFDRRAYDVLNAITVVPGAVGAWRASAVKAVGGYATDTLAEDADLTWRVRKAGWRIRSEENAHAYTEAPERLNDLLKQRFRWSFGILQSLWKHRDVTFNPKYGWLGMVVAPSLWIFSYLLPLAAPFADLGLIAAVLSNRLPLVLAYFALFAVIEITAAFIAFSLDTVEKRHRGRVFWLLVQRFVWRYLLLWVLLRAVGAALNGVRTGWGKLERRGTAQVYTVAKNPQGDLSPATKSTGELSDSRLR